MRWVATLQLLDGPPAACFVFTQFPQDLAAEWKHPREDGKPAVPGTILFRTVSLQRKPTLLVAKRECAGVGHWFCNGGRPLSKGGVILFQFSASGADERRENCPCTLAGSKCSVHLSPCVWAASRGGPTGV